MVCIGCHSLGQIVPAATEMPQPQPLVEPAITAPGPLPIIRAPAEAGDARIIKVATRAQARRACRRRYGKRFRGLQRRRGRFFCVFRKTRSQARRECRRRHGKRLIRVQLRGGQFQCVFRRTPAQIRAIANRRCRNRFGARLLNVRVQGTRYTCVFRRAGGGQGTIDEPVPQ